jgi:hypothetical protein
MSEDYELTVHLNNFDSAWQSSKLGNLPAFFATASTGCASDVDRRQLLIELIKIDLEHRWRAQGSSVERPELREESLHGIPLRPRLEDYRRQFPELLRSDNFPDDLIAEEFRVRHRWGDRPPMDEYVRRFGTSRSFLGEVLDELTGEFGPLLLKVYREQMLVFQCPVRDRFELGRQRRNEPPPFQWHDGDDARRLIIATRQENRISRQQLRVSVVSTELLQLKNVSSKDNVVILPEIGLKPRETRTFGIPVVAVIGSFVFRFEPFPV